MREFGGAGKQMHMAFDEAWNDRAAFRIDDARRRAAKILDRGALADRDDLAIGDGQRLGCRTCGVDCLQPSVDDDQLSMVRHETS